MIPAELRALPQWVAWRLERRQKPSGEWVPTKVPYNPAYGRRRASSTDATTWGTYRQALSVLDADGIGFVFSPEDSYCGVDMDGCVSANGTIHPAAYEVVRTLSGYVEFSPSGRGLHIIVRASLPRGRHTLKTPWGDEFAAYDRGRFFTMSGDARGAVREAQAELNALISFYFPEEERVTPPVTRPAPFCGDDAAVLDRIHADHRIAALWTGDVSAYGGDHSQADLALCAHLAYFTGNDPDRIDSLFRRSGLYREKWNEARGESTYGRITIERAIRR